MEQLDFAGNYSFKNIPTPGKLEYMKQLVDSIEKLLRRMRWRAFYFIQIGEGNNSNNGDDTQCAEDKIDENIRFQRIFKSEAKPPFIEEMENFEKDLLELPKKLEYRKYSNPFQRTMKEDLSKIKRENMKNIIVPADKTRNYYVCNSQKYDKLLTENVSKEYRQADQGELTEVNTRALEIARKEGLEKRMEIYTPGNARFTYKDHKQCTNGKIPCRVINPAKTHVGKLSQVILREKITLLRENLKLNHWKSTGEVLEWFNTLKHTNKATRNPNIKFIKFDIEQFYPSITRELLHKSIQFARENGVFICKHDLNIIETARETFLFKNGTPYVKKNRNDRFDVPMGGWDSAEISEICGMYLLDRLTNKNGPFEKSLVGLYRDDGLGVVKGTDRTRNKIRKQIE